MPRGLDQEGGVGHLGEEALQLEQAARDRGISRWTDFLGPLPDRLRDDDLTSLRSTALRARAAYGTKDSVRDALPADLTEPFLEAIDRLLRELARREAAER